MSPSRRAPLPTGFIKRETLRVLLIGSTVVAATLSFVFGLPRLQRWITPDLQRVWVVSSSLGDALASAAPQEVLAGSPVTLYAIVETGRGSGRRFFGPVERARLGGEGAEVVDVEPWSSWWNALEILWFKVEPLYSFDNENLSADFDHETIAYHETLQLTWGFRPRHAADTTPTGDDFPRVEVGTMRFKARAVVRDHRDRILDEAVSLGAERVHADSIAEQPHRVSIRASDAALGVMQAYSGLPYVPVRSGLSPEEHPAARFIGGTILDFWIASQRRLGSELPFVSWEELPEHATVVVDEMFLAQDGHYYFTLDPLRQVTFDEVGVGDLITIEDHVGVLYQDRSPGGGGDGILNRWDRLLGGYFEPLRDLPLGDAFHSGITVYRLRVPGGGMAGAPRAQ